MPNRRQAAKNAKKKNAAGAKGAKRGTRGKAGPREENAAEARSADVMHGRSFAGTEYASTEEEQTRDRRGESRELDRPDGTHGGGLAKPLREGDEGAPNPSGW